MDQQHDTVLRERVIATLLGLAGVMVFMYSMVEMPWKPLTPVHIVLAITLAVGCIQAERYPIHLARGTKIAITTLPLYLGTVLLPAPLAIGVASSGLLTSSLLMRARQGLLPRDIIATVGQWMIIVFFGNYVSNLLIPGLDQHFTHLILLIASALIFLFTDFTIFSLTNSFILKEPFLRTLKSTFLNGADVEGIQLLVAILGALAVNTTIWALPLVFIPAITTYITFKSIKEVKLETLQLLEDMADTVDLRDIYTGGHSRRVADLVRQTLTHLEIYGQEAAIIETAARLHDIGKIGIPDDVLKKPGRLTPEEMLIMQTHSEKGANLIAKYKDFSRGALMIKHHHESWDGFGYPGRLKGYQIPFGSRVIAVADSFDAMTSDRPYRKALSARQAIQILLKGRGKQWDYGVVNAFVEAVTSQLDGQAGISLTESEISVALSNTISTPSNI